MASIYDRANKLSNEVDPDTNAETDALEDAVKEIIKRFTETQSELNAIADDADKADAELESVIDVLKNIDPEMDPHDIETEIKHAIELLENLRTALY